MSTTPSIDSALILTTGRIFHRPGGPQPAGPLTVVGGLSLFQRTVLTLQRSGLSRFVILAGEETETLKRQLHKGARIKAETRWLPVREFPTDDPRTWEVFPNLFGAPFLVAGTGAVFPASLVARMLDEAASGEAVVVVRETVLRQAQHERVIEGASGTVPITLSLSQGETGGVMTLETAVVPSLDVDLVLVPVGFFTPGWATAQDRPSPLHAALEHGLCQGQAKVLPLGPDWYQDVCAEGGASPDAAERTLLRSLTEGLWGTKWISQLLMKTSLTPHGVALLAVAVGVLSGAVFALGGYAAGVAGALLFNLAAILARCDQEVARLKFMEAPLGRRRVEAIRNYLVRRDLSILILALALLGHVEWFLQLAAVASNVFWPVLAWRFSLAKSPASAP